jgi:hypothetical protein
MDLNGIAEGQKAGLCSIGGRTNTLIGATKKNGQLYVFYESSGKVTGEKPVRGRRIWFKAILDIENQNNQFYYSLDNKTFMPLGDTFRTSFGNWKGTRLGLYSFNESSDSGSAAFNWFIYDYDGPKSR